MQLSDLLGSGEFILEQPNAPAVLDKDLAGVADYLDARCSESGSGSYEAEQSQWNAMLLGSWTAQRSNAVSDVHVCMRQNQVIRVFD